jgi:hypothetical protein
LTETVSLFSSATPPPETICGGPETMYILGNWRGKQELHLRSV